LAAWNASKNEQRPRTQSRQVSIPEDQPPIQIYSDSEDDEQEPFQNDSFGV
jgi:hypothetical protein